MIYKLLILFLILCGPIVYYHIQCEMNKSEPIFFEIVKPKPIIIIELEQNETESEIVEPKINETVKKPKINETISQKIEIIAEKNETEKEIEKKAPKTCSTYTLNEQNSKNAINKAHEVNFNRNTVIIYTDYECCLRVNPNIRENEMDNLALTVGIPLNTQIHEKWCKYLRFDFE